jgi:hypothetical protein
MARKLSAAHGLGADDLIISRRDLEELQGHLYALQAALEDVEGDLDQARTENSDPDYLEAFEWLAGAARPLSSVWIEPKGT